MDKQSEVSDIIILPHSELMPADEAQKKARALAKIQEQLLTMSNPLPDNLRMPDLSACPFHFNRDKRLTNFALLRVPFFSPKITDIFLSYHTNNTSPYEDYFQGDWNLSFDIFSDEPLRMSYAQFAKLHPKEGLFAKTIYLFNKTGTFAKLIWVHKDFAVERQLVLDLTIAKVYSSEMTQLDFAYAERALLVMKERLEDYRHLN